MTEIKNKLYNIRKLSVTDAHKEFPPSYFDIVLCYDLFHHLTSLEEYKQAVYALKTILKDNGYLFIADPDNNLFFKTMVYCSKIFTPIFPAFRLTAKNYFDTEKQEFDLYFANKEFLYKLLDRDFKIIKTKRAFYRSITIFQKIIK